MEQPLNQFGHALSRSRELIVEVRDAEGLLAFVNSPNGGTYSPAYEETLDEVKKALEESLNMVAHIKSLWENDKPQGEGVAAT
jgi:hypothetical protein